MYVFPGMRSYTFEDNILNIKDELEILENRRKLLFETLNLSKTLKKGNSNKKIFYESWVENRNNFKEI